MDEEELKNSVIMGCFTSIVLLAVVAFLFSVSSRDTKPSRPSLAVEAKRYVQPQARAKGVTLQQFYSLYNGMSYVEACGKLGTPGTLISSSHMDGIDGFMDPVDTVMYSWDGCCSLGSNMNAMFQNDRLISKSQFGLR